MPKSLPGRIIQQINAITRTETQLQNQDRDSRSLAIFAWNFNETEIDRLEINLTHFASSG
jgi:hypothetical protein